MINETYGTWYPEELMDKITEYIEKDGDVQFQIEDAIGSCLDYLEFGEAEGYKVIDIDYEIEDDEVIVNINLEFFLTIDASAHCAGEDFDLGSPSCRFSGLVNGRIPIYWESKNTGAISIGSQLENISIEEIGFLGVQPLYSNDDGYDEDEYEPDYYYEEYYEIDE
ncbi:hypothetical protein U729_312 [Clostridium baratii str. Sullivan]|uniref:Uncharacterized protein n=1 Tax=Clostridium baratii str. Sullivan TaxID=1415775 RepID=A0A0A7FS79_9CLOT|nr:hypothetical protein [Clostridium baratii]AIY82467.1 hypothetical protein U729_312 [Clostridium baratii str. Sullivan]